MDFADGPLVWVDCEMTGLDYRKDKLLEIAVSPARYMQKPIKFNFHSYNRYS